MEVKGRKHQFNLLDTKVSVVEEPKRDGGRLSVWIEEKQRERTLKEGTMCESVCVCVYVRLRQKEREIG